MCNTTTTPSRISFYRWTTILALTAAALYAYWRYAIPIHRVPLRSELVMLGDLDGDHRWTATDLATLTRMVQGQQPLPADSLPVDLNQNGCLDAEDVHILQSLVNAAGDPYLAEQSSSTAGSVMPRPRELYRYIWSSEYHPRPLWDLAHEFDSDSAIAWMAELRAPAEVNSYAGVLKLAVYSEAVRFDQAYRRRKATLDPVERDYANRKLTQAKKLHDSKDDYSTLLALVDLVEDAETLTVAGQPPIVLQVLAFRDHLRDLLGSTIYADFAAGRSDWHPVLAEMKAYLKADLGLEYDLERLGPPRNLTNLENYLKRAEWQYYKSTTREADFEKLISFAQRDPRYLRAVSRTSRKFADPLVLNHNLPMVLLFREALELKGGDKKRAVGLLDEAIRVPYSWVKSIPKTALPSSVAYDNFLLPGNKEDGADKSRHWNVFGGICLYKSAQEALDLALKREMKDLRDDKFTEPAMREFIRDMIANLNGMFHVMAVNPRLLAQR